MSWSTSPLTIALVLPVHYLGVLPSPSATDGTNVKIAGAHIDLRVGALRLPINIVPDDIVSRSATKDKDVLNVDCAGASIDLS